jgi:hypothetical protein
MWRDAPLVDMRLIEKKGWAESEVTAKACVVRAYDEVMKLARDAAVRQSRG